MRVLVTLFVLVALAVGGWWAWAVYMPTAPPANQFVLLRSGFSTHRIGVELKKAGVIHSVFAFRVWHQLHPKLSLKAGEYLFEKSASVPEVYDRIARGDIYFHEVTIPEGYTMFDIAKAMEDAGLGSADQFLKIAQTRTDLIADLAPEAKSLEGYLFPNTYQFTRTQSREEMLGAMVHQFRQVAQQIGLNSDVQRIVTMAAIIEKETASPDERPMVASVYYNRLVHRIALDADPSVIYAHLLAGDYSGSLHHADLAVDSPYNTYRFPGLPPGPIANPGKGALAAAMHPAETQYFYFVSDGNGHHRFAHDLTEHNRNVAAYRRALGMH
ncbi:MAG TPA: endolytic transglycosylase MltG [Terriglobales bacterium]|nr:endolytic transglycosylase MltG [Terriglobales bacterium]